MENPNEFNNTFPEIPEEISLASSRVLGGIAVAKAGAVRELVEETIFINSGLGDQLVIPRWHNRAKDIAEIVVH